MTSRPPKPAPRRMKAAPAAEIEPQSYAAFVSDLRQKIAEARHRAGLSVNRELILLYWSIGRDILARQEREGWGAKIIDRLAADLRRAFPEMSGLSSSKPEIYARLRRGLARQRICATGCCTIALGP